MRGGFIKLHRKILEWEWYTEPHMLRLFVHLIFSANYEDKSWRGIEVKRGSFITSWQGLSESLNLSVQTVRTCIKRLESTGEISRKSTNKFTIITICKYDSYQDFNPISNNQVTNEQQTTNKQLTTTKEIKNIRNKEDIIIADSIVEYFNGVCIDLPKVIKVTDKRKKHILARLNEFSKEDVKKVIDLTSQSNFLNGKNKNGWTASFDWIMEKSNFIKILENNYTNKNNGKDRRQISVEDFNESIERHFR